MVQSNRPILLVEDSPEDYVATLRALKRSGLTQPLVRAVDGDDALDYLYARGRYEDAGAARPAFILLDLNLPGTDGFDVLTDIKSNESLRWIPVAVLTTSADARDVQRCYERGANSFIRKPVDLKEFVEAIEVIHRYWLQVAILPEGAD